ncbi:right-handed parallel beta-helix repeat-containing protein [Paenibacillus physcomitrellae]|uniref:Carbohydrate-binding protein n=1 Tax=Paenibacillus physcomitrellae TaxID=1619311 RepID=A0ABQ1FZE2_9BACL|nr:right-handed parallel beta-helix repeat-containing protein [Paenibacillus physcomitrellae]GGA33901.1 hypothetical protein GCM10010917_18920 [Paenibacillus physcomitrellae]
MLKRFTLHKLIVYFLTLSLIAMQAHFSPSAFAASAVYEAELAVLSGGAAQAGDHTGYTGSGFVGGYTDGNKGSASTTFSVSVSQAGDYTAELRYANGTGSAKTLSLYLNGAKLKQISLPATADWNAWGTQSEMVQLNAGSNTLAYKFDTSDTGNVNLDHLSLSASLGTNLAFGKSVTANNNYPGFSAANAVDGNSSTYYEGAASSYPNTLTVDLGSVQNVDTAVLKLPPSWGARSQTFSILGSTNNSTYSTLAASKAYTFDPVSNNTVQVSLTAAAVRYVRVSFTANTGATGGQAAEFEIYNTGSAAPSPSPSPSPTPTPTPTPTPSPGTYGATMPYDTFEAEDVSYTGTVIGPSTMAGDLASEASGRKAVKLTSAGQYVQFTLAKAAQGLTIRYAIPDNAAGTGIDSAISLYIGGTLYKDVNLTSRYTWNYGEWNTEGGQIRWSNNPNAVSTTPHHMYDEVSVLLDRSYPAGTVIKLQRNSSNLNFGSAAYVAIDLLEAEAVPAPLTMPSNYVSITEYGASANDGADDTAAFNSAVNAVKNSGGTLKGVWIPAGTFTLNNGTKGAGYDGTGTRLYLDSGISVKGAGIWYSTLSGNYAGFYLRGGNVTLSDFKISANDIIRDDYNGVSGIEGNGTNATLTHLWIEHTKVGIWLTNQTSGASVSNNRIRDVWADGLNLHYGTSNTTVTNNSIRNSGDDGMAMWSDTYLDTNNTFSYNTVQLPTLANNIAVYGGKDNQIIGNLVTDTVLSGSGISFGTNFNPPSLTGTLTIQNNKLLRTGSMHRDYGYQIGAIWAYWVNNNGKAQNLSVTVSGNTIQDSTYSGIFVEEPAPGISIQYASNTILNAGTYGVYIRGSASGASIFTNNTVSGGAPSGLLKNDSPNFTVSGTGNSW